MLSWHAKGQLDLPPLPLGLDVSTSSIIKMPLTTDHCSVDIKIKNSKYPDKFGTN
jgi:hypothetical protein